MIAGGGKKKGGLFERTCAKRLSLWITNGKRKDILWRTAMSGGRATIYGRDVRQCGDLCAVAPEGFVFSNTFFVECKFVRNLNLVHFFIHGKGALRRYWDTARTQARNHGREPFLIVKQNGLPELVLVQTYNVRWGNCTQVIHGTNLRCYVYHLATVLKNDFPAFVKHYQTFLADRRRKTT